MVTKLLELSIAFISKSKSGSSNSGFMDTKVAMSEKSTDEFNEMVTDEESSSEKVSDIISPVMVVEIYQSLKFAGLLKHSFKVFFISSVNIGSDDKESSCKSLEKLPLFFKSTKNIKKSCPNLFRRQMGSNWQPLNSKQLVVPLIVISFVLFV